MRLGFTLAGWCIGFGVFTGLSLPHFRQDMWAIGGFTLVVSFAAAGFWIAQGLQSTPTQREDK